VHDYLQPHAAHLARELLRAQAVCLDQLAGHAASLQVTITVQHPDNRHTRSQGQHMEQVVKYQLRTAVGRLQGGLLPAAACRCICWILMAHALSHKQYQVPA
jgi:hypothetical protein